MEQGLIFNIQKFSIHDGPGIRTTVFFKGCPLKCDWCSNPESQLNKIQILCDHNKCIHCNNCQQRCPVNAISFHHNKVYIDNNKCIGCLKCVENCPTKSLSVEGEWKEIDQIVKTCLQDKDFYEESGGGVTISGGEAMIQPSFLKDLVNELKKENIHLAIETTGYVKSSIFFQLAPLFDLLLFDVKHHNTKTHQEHTGVFHEQIISNLSWAISNNINVLVRIAVIPDFNNTLEDAKAFSTLLKSIGVTKVQLLPFHQFGENKYNLLNRSYKMANKKALHPEDLNKYVQIFLDQGIDCFI
ncbi:glycyl-radical enzyme activating protein [Tannockella kyphosi]|uniref:glycyl-radical enzyme activating protein n=1 Tax=Tannockella kyphosi TaxID=2899121 RepID=UPI0020139C3C|nr:glycyl-radical enzyme activating protein [Tannockella kyphosi]